MIAPAPQVAPAEGMLAQILVKQGEMGMQLAVITEKLADLPDHEQRIRILEAAKAKVWGAAVVLGAVSGGGAGWIALAIARH